MKYTLKFFDNELKAIVSMTAKATNRDAAQREALAIEQQTSNVYRFITCICK